jgi:hypothetical protein
VGRGSVDAGDVWFRHPKRKLDNAKPNAKSGLCTRITHGTGMKAMVRQITEGAERPLIAHF